MAEETTSRVVWAIDEAWAEGCPVAQSAEMIAPIALRRWQSCKRRGIAIDNQQARITDLAKGLIQRMEAEPQLVGPLQKDYEYLATKIASSLLDHEAGQ